MGGIFLLYVLQINKIEILKTENNAQKEEQDYMKALKQIEELKTLNRSTFMEDEDYTPLNKQLQDTQEYLLFIESK